jgi:hypothetical protein
MYKLLIGKCPTGQAAVRGLYKDDELVATFCHLTPLRDFNSQIALIVGTEDMVEKPCEAKHVLDFLPSLKIETLEPVKEPDESQWKQGTVEEVVLTPAEKAKITRAKNKAKKSK